MAAAEARAAWQRTANRYFVQEDAKRAPKLACCPPSSAPQQNDLNSNDNAANEQENPTPNFVPSNWNPMNPNLSSDTRWWLQLQPNYGILKDITPEEELKSGVPTSTLRKESLDPKNADCTVVYPRVVPTTFTKQNLETKADGMKTVSTTSDQPCKRKIDSEDYFLDPNDKLVSKKTEKGNADLDSAWTGGNKCGPWWRISDQHELTFLVAQKSRERIENCDLPRPAHTVPVSTNPFACLESLDGNKMFSSTGSCSLQTSLGGLASYTPNTSSSGSLEGKYWSSTEAGYLPDSEKPYSTTPSTATPTENSENLSSRDQLLEALCHSQTRAREAEMAAQNACLEKEHILSLFFKQASHLFAYKQWVHLLQIENLCLQLRIKEQQLSALFPLLPWMPLKGNEAKMKRKEEEKKNCSFRKYAVMFAVGLGLAGAGLLFGWLLPHF